MRLTKVTLELSDSDWIFILDSLIDRRDNLADLIGMEWNTADDLIIFAEGISQANALITLIHGRIAD
jgi:hypothetical protein